MAEEYRSAPKADVGGQPSDDEGRVHVDRRQFMRYGMTASTAVFAASLGAVGYATILMPGGGGGAGDLAVKYWVPKGQEDSAWYAASHNQVMKVSALKDEANKTTTKMAGAAGVWNGLPVIVVHIPDSLNAGTPLGDNKPRTQLMEGVDATGKVVGHAADYEGDPAIPHDDIAVIFGRCPHLCCIPGWQLVSNNFTADNWTAGGTDSGGSKLFCICHSSRFDPTAIEVNQTSKGIQYIGIRKAGGPAPVGPALIPFDIEGAPIVGRPDYMEWYTYCD